MKSFLFVFLLCGLFFIISCDKETIDPGVIPGNNAVLLGDLKVGQKSYYAAYTSQCEDLTGSFQWTGDTLVVEVVHFQDDIALKEYLTPGSKNAQGSREYFQKINSLNNDYIAIPDYQSSNLFNFFGSDSILLKPKSRPAMVQNSCVIKFNGATFTGNEIGSIERFTIGPVSLKNKTVVSCVPTILNLDAYLFYDENQLYLSHQAVRTEFNGVISPTTITGWRLIE